MMEGLAGGDAELKTVMVDATYINAYLAASSLRFTMEISASFSNA